MRAVVRHLRRTALLRGGNGPADGDLLDAFLTRREEAAFEALLRRHGAMVLGVCRRVLRHEQDAEDAFQATFLVLARKAASVRPRDMVGAWLYGVACRTALKARAMSAKRRERERRAGQTPRAETADAGASEEVLAQLDAALSRLPNKYRVPVVLCELEGRSRKEVADRLQIPEGTLSSRLAYAKKLLARRLARYGPALSVGALAGGAASASVPRPLLSATARAAMQIVAGESVGAGVVSAEVLALTEGIMKAMLLSKIKGLAAVAVVLLAGIGALSLAYRPAAAQPPGGGGGPPRARAVADELEELRLEVAALRKGLQVTRDRVRVLEDEVETLKARQARPMGGGGSGGFGGLNRGGGGAPGMPGMPGMPGGPRMGSGRGGGSAMPMGPGRGPAGAGPGGPREPGDNRNPGTPAGPGGLAPAPAPGTPAGSSRGGKLDPTNPFGTGRADDPLADAEQALKKLRENPQDKQAADALGQALKRLRDNATTQERATLRQRRLELERQRQKLQGDGPKKE
jgi:RNA polymerase sigma factor (sigma-70 family)